MERLKTAWGLALILGSVAIDGVSAAQFAYPPAERTAEQQQQDQFECHQWAVTQTSYDPTKVTADTIATSNTAAATKSASGAAIEGAARGAAVAEIGDEDTADGARAGAAFGLIRNRRAQAAAAQENMQAQRAAQQQKQQQAAQRSAYDSARNTCLKARGYTLSDP